MTENFQHTDTVAPKDNQIAPHKLSTEISDIVKDHPTLALVTAATTGAGASSMIKGSVEIVKTALEIPEIISKVGTRLLGKSDIVPSRLLAEVEKPYSSHLLEPRDTRIKIAENLNLPPHIQSQIIEHEKDPEILTALAANPKLDSALLPKLFETVRDMKLYPTAQLQSFVDQLAITFANRKGLSPVIENKILESIDKLEAPEKGMLLHTLAHNEYFSPGMRTKIFGKINSLEPDMQAEILNSLASRPNITAPIQRQIFEGAKWLDVTRSSEVLTTLAARTDLDRDLQEALWRHVTGAKFVFEKGLPPNEQKKVLEVLTSNKSFPDYIRTQGQEILSKINLPTTSNFISELFSRDSKLEFTTFAAATNQSLLSKAIKFTGPVGLAVVPLVEAIHDGYEVSKHGGNALEIMGSSALGAGKGVVDTYLPSARSGYSDVFGKKRVTGFDRFLNAANDVTGTATAVGATALAVEVAGIATIPAAIPTGFITAAAGLSNLGINVIKLGAKVSGIAGKDQDGGYIYDGAALAINGVEHLIGHSSK